METSFISTCFCDGAADPSASAATLAPPSLNRRRAGRRERPRQPERENEKLLVAPGGEQSGLLGGFVLGSRPLWPGCTRGCTCRPAFQSLSSPPPVLRDLAVFTRAEAKSGEK